MHPATRLMSLRVYHVSPDGTVSPTITTKEIRAPLGFPPISSPGPWPPCTCPRCTPTATPTRQSP